MTVNFMGLMDNELKRLSQDKKSFKNFGHKQFFTGYFRTFWFTAYHILFW